MLTKKIVCTFLIITFIVINFQGFIYAKETQDVTGNTSNSDKLEPVLDDKNMLISNIPFETTVKIFKKYISGKITMIQNAKGEEITKNNDAIITTGTKVIINKKEYAVVVNGDLDGDGIYTYKDVLIEEDYLKNGKTDRKDATDFEYQVSGNYSAEPVSAPKSNKLKLFAKTDSKYQSQNFAITDIGTSNQIIWYGCNSKAERDKNHFVVRAFKGASGSNVGHKVGEITFVGGGHQVFSVIKNTGGYHIYTGAYAIGSECSPQGLSFYSITNSIPNGKKVDVRHSGINTIRLIRGHGAIRHVYAFGVDEVTGKMVASITQGIGATVFNVNKTKFSSSTKERKLKSLNHKYRPCQGGCLVGKYFYVVEDNKAGKLRIACYDIEKNDKKKAKLVWEKYYRITMGSNWEPEGIQVYNYKGKNRIFIGFIQRFGYNKGIYYVDD